MKWSQIPLQLFLALTMAPGLEPHETATASSLPADETPVGPVAQTWKTRRARVPGSVVRLRGIGVRTHANWVLFRLPFDTTRTDRIRSVRFRPSSRTPTGVGALRVGSVCFSVRPAGEVEDWTLYTMSGIGHTSRFAWHPGPPTSDPSMLGINVPTRVANYSACDLDEGQLRNPDNWAVDIEWDER